MLSMRHAGQASSFPPTESCGQRLRATCGKWSATAPPALHSLRTSADALRSWLRSPPLSGHRARLALPLSLSDGASLARNVGGTTGGLRALSSLMWTRGLFVARSMSERAPGAARAYCLGMFEKMEHKRFWGGAIRQLSAGGFTVRVCAA